MKSKKSFKKWRLFVIITFLLSWSLAGLFYISGGRLNSAAGLIMAIFYMCTPALVAILLQKFIYKEPVKSSLGISFSFNLWFILGWLLPPAIAFTSMGVSLLLPGIDYSPDMAGMFERLASYLTPQQLEQLKKQLNLLPLHPIWITLIQGLLAGVSINALTAFGEELGWRGMLQKEFEPLGFWRSSLLIGAIWGTWHIPFIIQGYNYPQHPQLGILMMIIFTLLFSPLISFIRIKSGSVIAAAIMHGTLNATYGISIMIIRGGNDLTVGVMGLSGFIALMLFNLGLFIFTRLSKEL